ncbi:MAG: hypothetical protein ACRBDL_08015 [Alphaproteobacteria bacterium]
MQKMKIMSAATAVIEFENVRADEVYGRTMDMFDVDNPSKQLKSQSYFDQGNHPSLASKYNTSSGFYNGDRFQLSMLYGGKKNVLLRNCNEKSFGFSESVVDPKEKPDVHMDFLFLNTVRGTEMRVVRREVGEESLPRLSDIWRPSVKTEAAANLSFILRNDSEGFDQRYKDGVCESRLFEFNIANIGSSSLRIARRDDLRIWNFDHDKDFDF